MQTLFKPLKKIQFGDIYVALFSVGLFVMPLITDKSHLPQGWELPKVFFIQYFSLLLIAFSFGYTIFLLVKKKYKWDKSNWWLIAILLLFSLTTVLSGFGREVSNTTYTSVIQQWFGNILSGSKLSNISMFGNEMRDAGFITYSLITIVLFNLSKILNKKRINLLLLSIIFSALYQAIIGLSQFNLYLNDNVSMIAQGQWIFGTYGQSNFYAGHLLLGVVLSTMHLRSLSILQPETDSPLAKNSKVTKYLALISIMILSVAIIASVSTWGIVMLIYALIIVFSYELLPFNLFYKLVAIPTVGIIILFTSLAFIFVNYLPEVYQFRTQIWLEIYMVYVYDLLHHFSLERLLMFIFGGGFDALGKVFHQAGSFPGIYIDRAHNFILEIFTTLGLTGLILFSYSFKSILTNIKSKLKSPLFAYPLFALIIWMTRSLVHTSSIVNIFQGMVLFIVVWNISGDRNINTQ